MASREKISLPDRQDAAGGVMALRRWPTEDKRKLVFAHATGMCASAYQQFLSRLSDGYDITAPDLRGHGRTRLPYEPDRLKNWSVYARDLEALLLSQKQPQEGWCLAGHSMGAVTSLLCAAAGKVRVSHLVLIDPVIVPAWARWITMLPLGPGFRQYYPIARRAARRRATWPDYNTVVKGYARNPFFKRWASGVLEDYLEDGLTESAEEVHLSCNPQWEAATFGAQGQNVWQALRQVQDQGAIKLHVILAEKESTVSESGRARLRQRGISIQMLPGTGHLIPQEQPGLAADTVQAILQS